MDAGMSGQAHLPHAGAKPRELKQGSWVSMTWRPPGHEWHTLMQAGLVRHDATHRNDAAEDARQHGLEPLIEPGHQSCGPGAVGVVLGAKLRAQQPLFGTDACEERRDHEPCEQQAHP
jgi:hypothetical protein